MHEEKFARLLLEDESPKVLSEAVPAAAVAAPRNRQQQLQRLRRRRRRRQQQQQQQQLEVHHLRASSIGIVASAARRAGQRCLEGARISRPSTGSRGVSYLLLTIVTLSSLLLPIVLAHQNYHICPGCSHRNDHKPHHNVKDSREISPDVLRLEAIKHQILTKLGLRSRPDVNRTLAVVPRHLALETLYRAEAQPTHYSERRKSYEGRSGYSEFFYESGDGYAYGNLDGATERGSGAETTVDPSPSSTTPAAPPQNHHRGDESQEREEEVDDFYARTSEIITFAEPGRTLNGQPLLEFPMTNGEPVLEPLKIKRATLWTRVELKQSRHYQHHRQEHGGQRNITLWVFRVRCGNTTHLRGKELGQHLEMAASLGVNVGQLGWQKFDVTYIVRNWYLGQPETPRDKLTLLVDCTGCGTSIHVSTFGRQTSNSIGSPLNRRGAQDSDRPFLVVHTDPTGTKRIRRRAIECSGAAKGQCCKQRFYVSFSQLGWDDWIIAPQGYYANYCRGNCASGHRTPDTFLNYYTHVIEEYRKMDRLAGMQPCCAPLKFSPMSLIYYGPDSNIIKRDLPKMVVDECGCP